MAVIGGLDATVGNITDISLWQDPWPQGIGIFDLSNMEWKDHYDPEAGPYRTPEAVKDWYRQNGRYPSQWNVSAVEGWFTRTGTSSSRYIPTIRVTCSVLINAWCS